MLFDASPLHKHVLDYFPTAINRKVFIRGETPLPLPLLNIRPAQLGCFGTCTCTNSLIPRPSTLLLLATRYFHFLNGRVGSGNETNHDQSSSYALV